VCRTFPSATISRNAFLAVLDKYTLADLLTPQNALIRLLDVARA